MTLKKPSDLFKKENLLITEDYSPLTLDMGRSDMSVGLTETFDRFKNNLEKIDELTEQVQSLSEEIDSKLTKKDLENAMISHLMVVNENFKLIQDQVKGLNKSDLNKFHKGLNEVVSIVDNLVSVEIPKYNKKLAGSEFAIENKFVSFKDDITDKISQYHDIIDDFKRTIDESYELRSQIQDELSSVKDIKETVETYSDKINEFQHTNNSQLRKVENFILKNHNHIVELRKEVFNEISKLSLDDINDNIERIEKKIKYIENVYNSINAESLIGESLLSEPPQTDNGDPLTPLDRKFITQKDLQNHYRLFINRVQQQLATLGGGGETQLKYLDDIVGIATNPSAYDGQVLSYNHSLKKFEFVPNGGGNAVITISDTIPLDPTHGDLWYDSTIGRTFIYYVDVDGPQWVDASPSGGLTYPVFWSQTNAGIHTLSNVGIGTTNPTGKLEVSGNIVGTSATFTGSDETTSIVSIAASTVATPTNFGLLGIGRTLGFEDTNVLAHFTDDVDSYSQVIIQNHNAGPNASADFIVNNNQEEGTQYYGDFGMNGTFYEGDPSNPFSDPNGVYLYSSGGSLTIGCENQTPIKFAVNFTEVARIVEEGFGIGTTQPTSKLTVDGDVYITGISTFNTDVTIDGGLTVSGNIVGTSATFTPVDIDKPVVSIAASTIDAATNFGLLGVGRTIGFEDTNIIAHFTDDVDSYSQVVVQNHSAGPNASADFIVNNNQEEGIQYYGDFGINSSDFLYDQYNPFSDPNGVYLYSVGGTLTIGCQDDGPLKFSLNFEEIARMVDGNFGIGTTQPTSKLSVQGDLLISGISTFSGGDVTVEGSLDVGASSTFGSDLEVDGSTTHNSDVFVETSGGLVLTSPNGTKYRLLVSNSGQLSTVLF